MKPDAEQIGGSIKEETIMYTLEKAVNNAHETYDKIADATSHAAVALGEKSDDLNLCGAEIDEAMPQICPRQSRHVAGYRGNGWVSVKQPVKTPLNRQTS